jgi:hypothetical protein
MIPTHSILPYHCTETNRTYGDKWNVYEFRGYNDMERIFTFEQDTRGYKDTIFNCLLKRGIPADDAKFLMYEAEKIYRNYPQRQS